MLCLLDARRGVPVGSHAAPHACRSARPSFFTTPKTIFLSPRSGVSASASGDCLSAASTSFFDDLSPTYARQRQLAFTSERANLASASSAASASCAAAGASRGASEAMPQRRRAASAMLPGTGSASSGPGVKHMHRSAAGAGRRVE